VIGLLLIAVAAVYGVSTYRFNRTHAVQVEAVEIPTDQTSIEYGKRVAAIRSCMTCHGDEMAGQIEFRLSYAPAKLDWEWRGKKIKHNLKNR
jgi:cytochrome c553